MLLVILFAVGASSMMLHPMNETIQINKSDLDSVPIITAMIDYMKDMLDEINAMQVETVKQGCLKSKSLMQEEDPGHYMASARMICDTELRSMYYNCKSLCSALATFATRLSCESQNWFTYMTQCGSGHRSMTCPGAVITTTTTPPTTAPTTPVPTTPVPTTELQMEGNSLASMVVSLETEAITLQRIAKQLVDTQTRSTLTAEFIAQIRNRALRVENFADRLFFQGERTLAKISLAKREVGLSVTVRSRADYLFLAASDVVAAANSLRLAADAFKTLQTEELPDMKILKTDVDNAKAGIVAAELRVRSARGLLSSI